MPSLIPARGHVVVSPGYGGEDYCQYCETLMPVTEAGNPCPYLNLKEEPTMPTPETSELSDWVVRLAHRKLQLAKDLYFLVYGGGRLASWDEAIENGQSENYVKDAWEILQAHPHLMDLETRENLEHLGLIEKTS